MAFSLQRLRSIPQRIGRSLIAANQYHSRSFLSTEPIPTPSEEDERNDIHKSAESETDPSLTETTQDYSHFLSEKPDSEYGRKMRIYMPAKAAGTQGVAKVGMWKVEPMNPGKRWGNPLMGWTSTRDPLQSINHGLERFASKEHAIEWCKSNGVFRIFPMHSMDRIFASTFQWNVCSVILEHSLDSRMSIGIW